MDIQDFEGKFGEMEVTFNFVPEDLNPPVFNSSYYEAVIPNILVSPNELQTEEAKSCLSSYFIYFVEYPEPENPLPPKAGSDV